MAKKTMGWSKWVVVSLVTLAAVGCAPLPGESYEYEGDPEAGAADVGEPGSEKGFRPFKKKKPVRVTGESCGNDGDSWTHEEGGCTYTITTSCKWREAVSPDGEAYKYCGCVDIVGPPMCPPEVEGPGF